MENNGEFGDINIHPVIKIIIKLFDDRKNNNIPIKNKHKYCSRVISELYTHLNKFNMLEKKDRQYIYHLIKSDYKNRINNSNLDEELMDLMLNLINGIVNKKIENMFYKNKQSW